MSLVLALLIVCLLALARSQCVPATPTAGATINPVLYNAVLSDFSQNGPNQHAPNDSSLLNLYVQWNATYNRNIKWIGIGNNTQCINNINSVLGAGNDYGNWSVSAPDSSSCVVTASASYVWPQSFYDLSCAPQFSITVDNTAETQTLTFTIFVQYDDCSNVTRNGVATEICNTITTELPVSVVFPLNTTINTLNPVAVFSASSVNVTAALASQTVSLTNPALSPTASFTFVTFVGESFELSAQANGVNGPVNGISIDLSSNIVTYPTRKQLWTVTVPVTPGACNIDGTYAINFTVYYTAVNGSVTLAPDQNPIPDNSSALVTFTLVSADFCAVFNNPSLTATLNPYRTNFTDYYGSQALTPHRGFLTGDVIYLGAHVVSDFLPLLTTRITKVYISNSNDPTYIELTLSDPLLSYGSAVGGVDTAYPRSDAVAWFVLDPSVFPVPGDENVQYNFKVDILVTYNNNGQKRSMTVTRSASSTSLASADTFALVAADPASSLASNLQASWLVAFAAVVATCLLL